MDLQETMHLTTKKQQHHTYFIPIIEFHGHQMGTIHFIYQKQSMNRRFWTLGKENKQKQCLFTIIRSKIFAYCLTDCTEQSRNIVTLLILTVHYTIYFATRYYIETRATPLPPETTNMIFRVLIKTHLIVTCDIKLFISQGKKGI